MIQLKPDIEAFNKVYLRYEQETQNMKSPYFYLTAKDIIDVFGWPGAELLLVCGSYNKEQISELINMFFKAIKDSIQK